MGVQASPGLKAQEMITLDGYLSDMQSIYHLDESGWLWENTLHNRLDLNIYPTSWLKFSLQGRTRIVQGNTYGKFPGYADMFGSDGGWIDLTYATKTEYSGDAGLIFTTALDRAYAEITTGNFVITAGRQRVNWGQTFVWNPNDIFNSYSYFDVDYPERPGSDALRIQYYPGMTSTIEAVAKVDSAGEITAAGYFRFNALGYDLQLLGGVLSEDDLILGGGWSGSIVNTSFRGEATYFRNLDSFKDTTGDLMLSLGLDHTFANSLWLQGELLYSGFAEELSAGSFLQLLSSDMGIKQLGFTPWSFFGSVSYPITALINGSLAGMYYPDWKGFYLGPSFDISVGDNLALSLIMQGFSVKPDVPGVETERQNTWIGYTRLKWSF